MLQVDSAKSKFDMLDLACDLQIKPSTSEIKDRFDCSREQYCDYQIQAASCRNYMPQLPLAAISEIGDVVHHLLSFQDL